MVMEAATLSGPHRKCAVVPVQKSLSLPSYARAGGEGIDHRLIFAALEQKERVRRKSRIFAQRKEKCNRQTHLFCLPIPTSGAKCRETSLSSDTSCSSLEYKKSSPVPAKKENVPKSRKEDSFNPEKEDITKLLKESTSEAPKQETLTYETATTIKYESKTTANPSRTHQDAIDRETNRTQTKLGLNSSQKFSEIRRGQRSPMDTLRLTACSSDSMERSSRSSSDSLSRKERMIALKARVEAAREKYGNTSSSEEEGESRSSITRYNSDGSIYRSVRDVKSRSFLREKRLRRRSQDEFSIKKTQRKQNLSLTINPEGDGIRLDLEKASKMQFSNNNLDIKTDFCPSPNFPDILKKNYFSDFPSKENAMHFVQARIRHIEGEERKRRSGSDFYDRFGSQKIQNLENASPVSTESRRPLEKPNELSNAISESKSSNFDLAARSSPIPRTSQAPTPPPRSPKSMTFINKALIQHQNSFILNQENSLERKKVFLSNVPSVSYSQIFEKFDSKIDLNSGDTKVSVTGSPNSTSEKQKVKELFSSRRKTCGNFDFIDNNILEELCSIGNSVSSTSSNLATDKKFSTAMQIKKTDSKGYFSGTETPGVPSEDDARNKMWKSKWHEIDQKKEYMFNSLESRKKSNPPSWMKWRSPPSKIESCLCHLFPDNKISCSCKSTFETDPIHSSSSITSKLDTSGLVIQKGVSSLPTKYSSIKLGSDTNLTNEDLTLNVIKDPPLKSIHLTRETITNGDGILKKVKTEKLSAAANLDSAMEELENVYRSLKMSSDNLSDRNSISNVSLSDDDVKFPKPKNKDMFVSNDSRFPRRSSVCETGLGSSKNFNYHKPTVYSPLKLALPVSNDKNTEINQCSIDELFNDLTQQLDLEQKLLKDPKDNRQQQHKMSVPLNGFDTPKRPNKPCPQVSIHKQFYENLCKSSLDQSIKNPSTRVSENSPSSCVEPLDKKRQKAVRSLSENISQLMTSINLDSNNKKAADSTNVKMSPDQPLQKPYERVLSNSVTNFAPIRDANYNQSPPSPKAQEKSLNLKRDEIRHIRVSMDTNILPSSSLPSLNSCPDSKQYPSLSSAVSAAPSSPKSETSNSSCLPQLNYESKENLDVIDETDLEKLLNSLLGEVPDRQSSLNQTRDLGPTTPPPIVPGKVQNVTANRSVALQKMDACIASKSKSSQQSPGAESYLKSVKSEDHAQKVTFRQNDNSISQPSFIPVYTKKTDMCHNFKKNTTEDKDKSKQVESSEPARTLNNLQSPSPRQKCLTDQIPGMAWNTHLRRRSVGFEDVASFSQNYGFNFANKRLQSGVNCNIPVESAHRPNNPLNLQNDRNSSFGKENGSERGIISTINQNSQVTENENNGFLKDTKLSQQWKDKSSKRKSSLNRLDFLDFSTTNTGNGGLQKASRQQKNNSSSDEGSDQSKSEFLSSKRKHISSNQFPSKDTNKSANEIPLQCSTRGVKNGAHLLPRALQNNHIKSRHHRRVQSAATHLQKFSHSAGELESLTDLSEAATQSNKICLSAQELDPADCSGALKKTQSSIKKYPRGPLAKSALSSGEVPKSGCGNASHGSLLSNTPENNSNSKVTPLLSKNSSDREGFSIEQTCKNELVSEDRPVLSSLELNGTLNLKHIDSRSEDDAEIMESTVNLKNLDISSEVSFDNEIYISADDNCDYPDSDSERRPNSILRKKVAEEKKELHGILKPSSDEKQSKTPPPSILKHRESSEEKDVWQQGDLHSILKKSTSEDESCNSGPDIRPILKVSTDDESPTCSMVRPRPILKKRTSFSEECSYASYPNGELKPILKKKSPLASDDQPRPILKSRRKSEDVRSTTSEFVPSRPRAYSADMGVKPNLETRFDLQESNKEDLGKPEDSDL